VLKVGVLDTTEGRFEAKSSGGHFSELSGASLGMHTPSEAQSLYMGPTALQFYRSIDSFLTAALIPASSSTAGYLDLYEDTDNGANRTRLMAPTSTSDVTFQLPSSNGTNGQALQTNGSGVTSWATYAAGPGSSTDNAVALWDGTGGNTLQNSVVIIDPATGNTTGVGTIASGANTITSSSATAFAVGQNGTTNPAFLVDASTASSATGLSITSAASSGGVSVIALGGTNENLRLSSKGTGNLALQTAGVARMTVEQSRVTVTPSTSSTAANARLLFTGAANTGLTGGAEFNNIHFNMGQTNQHASNTAITTQRDMHVVGMAHSFATSGGVITDAYGLYVTAPTAGTNATITNTYGIGTNSNIQASGVNIGGGGLITSIAAGTWTPTLTNVANLDGSTAFECQYLRIGNTVTGSCRVSINPTLAATSTQLGISLPVASNFGAIEDAAGACSASGIAAQTAAIIADTANDRLQLQYISGDVTDQPMTCSFSYQVI
jgi:hypothetical protein